MGNSFYVVVVVGNNTVALVGGNPSAGAHECVGVSPQVWCLPMVSAKRNDQTKNNDNNMIRQSVHEETTIAVLHIPQ